MHEAVDDGVDAGRGVGQKVDEGNGRTGQPVGRAPVKGLPCIDHEDRCPAQEEEEDDDQEHADDPLLGHQVGRRTAAVAACYASHHGCAAAAVAQVTHDALPFGRLHVTAIAVAGLEAAGAGMSV